MEKIRQQHDLEQGTQEWIQFRRVHKGASEIAAVLGLSRTTKRTELLRIKSTGMEKEFSDYVQKHVLDKGHEIEALARPIVEEVFVGDDLYPTVWSLGDKSASCDGLTMCETMAWENKQYNDEYYELVDNGQVPEEHMPQCQQVLMVTGAEKLLFTVSDGTVERTAGVWIYPDQEWFERINSAWAQFDKDLAGYEHVEYQEKPQAEATESFLVPFVQVKGELTIASNLDRFGDQLRSFVGNINKDPQDDQDFANLESAVKKLKEVEDALEKAESYALAQFSDVNSMRRTVDDLKELARSHRLTGEKLVKSQKELIKMRILNEAANKFSNHINGLQREIIDVRLDIMAPDFGGAMKNKRTIASLHDAVDTLLANSKIEADRIAKDVREKLYWLKDNADQYRFLFSDLQYIVTKNGMEAFQSIVTRRIDEHKKAEEIRLESERERIRLEEEAKAAAKLKADREEDERLERFKQAQAELREKASEVIEKPIIVESQQELFPEPDIKSESESKVAEIAKHDKKQPVAEQGPIKTIIVARSEYDQLKRDSAFLKCLIEAGVNNWDGYSIATAMMEKSAA
jgi:predicted phage-related endonuclease